MSDDDFEIEPVRGLPEAPPEGEQILWQGAPRSWALARDALCLYWVAGYFAALAAWRGIIIGSEAGLAPGIRAGLPFLMLGLAAIAILLIIAWAFAKTTVYTITNRRVAMRIGAALNVTLNLPFTRIERADLSTRRDGTGTIALSLLGGDKISYLVCWPHVRPWHMRRTQPAFRSIPDAASIAAILGEAAETRIDEVTARDPGAIKAPSDVGVVAAE